MINVYQSIEDDTCQASRHGSSGHQRSIHACEHARSKGTSSRRREPLHASPMRASILSLCESIVMELLGSWLPMSSSVCCRSLSKDGRGNGCCGIHFAINVRGHSWEIELEDAPLARSFKFMHDNYFHFIFNFFFCVGTSHMYVGIRAARFTRTTFHQTIMRALHDRERLAVIAIPFPPPETRRTTCVSHSLIAWSTSPECRPV